MRNAVRRELADDICQWSFTCLDIPPIKEHLDESLTMPMGTWKHDSHPNPQPLFIQQFTGKLLIKITL